MTRFLAISIVSILACLSCQQDAYYEVNKIIDNREWNYSDKIKFDVSIDDSTAKYDIFVNLRHQNSYDYANIYVLLHQKGKSLQDTFIRKEIKLAELDGKWIGKSAGTVLETQNLVHENFVFPDTGLYHFEIEQNMRVNPLKDIVDVGLKVVKK